jgi:hypothetical protein
VVLGSNQWPLPCEGAIGRNSLRRQRNLTAMPRKPLGAAGAFSPKAHRAGDRRSERDLAALGGSRAHRRRSGQQREHEHDNSGDQVGRKPDGQQDCRVI